MTTIAIHPVDVDGKTITSVALREPTGADMIELAEHLPELFAYSEREEVAKAEGRTIFPGSTVFAAMVAVAGAVTGLGSEAAGKLAFSDVTKIVMEAQRFLASAMDVALPTTGGSSSAPSPSA